MNTRDSEKRRHPRVDARIQVEFKTQQEYTRCYSKNISQGGIFLETEVLPDPNAVVELILDLSEFSDRPEAKRVSLTGRVVRLMTIMESSMKVHKVAIQFIEVEPYIRVLLDQLYEQMNIKAPSDTTDP